YVFRGKGEWPVVCAEKLVADVAVRAVSIPVLPTEPLEIYVVTHDPLTRKARRRRGHNWVNDAVVDWQQWLPDVNLVGTLERGLFVGLALGPDETVALERIDGAEFAPVAHDTAQHGVILRDGRVEAVFELLFELVHCRRNGRCTAVGLDFGDDRADDARNDPGAG